MEIKDKRNKLYSSRLKILDAGETFMIMEDTNRIYIKTDNDSISENSVYCVELNTGNLIAFRKDNKVQIVIANVCITE